MSHPPKLSCPPGPAHSLLETPQPPPKPGHSQPWSSRSLQLLSCCVTNAMGTCPSQQKINPDSRRRCVQNFVPTRMREQMEKAKFDPQRQQHQNQLGEGADSAGIPKGKEGNQWVGMGWIPAPKTARSVPVLMQSLGQLLFGEENKFQFHKIPFQASPSLYLLKSCLLVSVRRMSLGLIPGS